MVDVICVQPCQAKAPIVMQQEGIPPLPDIWPPAEPPEDAPSLDFSNPDNSQYIGQVV